MTNEEAIRLLKAMMDEMILVFDRDRKEALNMAIEALRNSPTYLPSAQQWIPCSERLLDNDESVLISNSHGVTKAWWTGRSWTSIAVKNYKTVIAWMPLPKPYEGKS